MSDRRALALINMYVEHLQEFEKKIDEINKEIESLQEQISQLSPSWATGYTNPDLSVNPDKSENPDLSGFLDTGRIARGVLWMCIWRMEERKEYHEMLMLTKDSLALTVRRYTLPHTPAHHTIAIGANATATGAYSIAIGANSQ